MPEYRVASLLDITNCSRSFLDALAEEPMCEDCTLCDGASEGCESCSYRGWNYVLCLT